MEEARRRMLIADDIEMNRAVIRKMFGHDFDVYEAESGTEVLEALEQERIDIVLLDIIMPGLDGLEVLSRIRQDARYENLAVLVATSTKEKTERSALALGADDIIAKPYDPVVVRKRVENILETRRLRRELRELQDELCGMRRELERLRKQA